MYIITLSTFHIIYHNCVKKINDDDDDDDDDDDESDSV